ncbi:MAG: 30S ribosome-binding factor RbfA [Candidatus Omnitrophica bacterium]|nr:30S ribosome-binding factor RbfA [Candidatus Omnitrophota bacterium]
MNDTRTQRLADQLQQEIAMIIHRELKDPDVGFVTITRVDLSKDLSHAKVFFSCLGSEQDLAESQDALNRSVRFVRGLIRKRFRLKVIPALVFCYDESIAGSIAIGKKLDDLRTTNTRDHVAQ